VQSVVRLFEGMPRGEAAFHLGDEIVANLPPFEDLNDPWLLDNLNAAREANGMSPLWHVERDAGPGLAGVESHNFSYPSFTVEMETGTGKTYVYLRTIYELRKRYGWSKFVIVVPSIAIYEGVIKNVQVTRDHFRALYDNEPFDLIPYDGAQLSRIRHFATANTVTVLLITLAAFNSVTNNLYKASEKLPGERRPFQFVQETRPVLILDEPQNMESERAKEALRTLNPLLALRYGATHRSSPNPVYRLTPFEAYARNLVKHIEVYGVTEKDNPNLDFLTLHEITPPPRITARVGTRVTDRSGTRETEMTLHQSDKLWEKTGRPEHAGGYVVENIDAGAGFVEFANGERLYVNEGIAPSRPAILRKQIRQTIRRHMEWRSELLDDGIKVLSLFFVACVASYTAPDGLVRRLFDEEFERAKFDFLAFRGRRSEEVRSAYFAKKKLKDGSEEAVDTESRTVAERELEKQAFGLIMRDKERLLTFDEPVGFIFAHSALKEGWDNPNVFQICTLNETRSEIKKRQEIGRGMRLCVDQTGERVHSEEVNVLTVVANESYRTYAQNLQREYVESGDAAPALPGNARARKEAQRRPEVYDDPKFAAFWERLNRRMRYHIHVDTDALIEECVIRLNKAAFPGHVLVVEKGRIHLGSYKVKVEKIEPGKARIRFTLFDEDGEPEEHLYTLKPGEDVARESKQDRLRPLGTVAIENQPEGMRVVFTGAGMGLFAGQEKEYTPEGFGGQARERLVQVRAERYPVFNLIERTVQQTGLTRPTVNTIFRRIAPQKKRFFLQNPEGFATVFVSEVRNALADHITQRIEFTLEEGEQPYEKETLFPEKISYPQKEVIEVGVNCLYSLVRKDSDVEAQYVQVLEQEGDAIRFYFKFPPKFRIDFPAIIGNYNPDWGVARIHRNGAVEARTFVHETKGTTDIARLQFPHEKRKIECAKKYFAAIGVNYKPIDPKKVGGWWEIPEEAQKLL
jgi:type III restriction enzyme